MTELSYEVILKDILSFLEWIQLIIVFDINGNCVASAAPNNDYDEKAISTTSAMAFISAQKIMNAFELLKFNNFFVRSKNGYVIMFNIDSNRILAIKTTKEVKLGLTWLDIKRRCQKIAEIPYEMPESKINLKDKLNELEMQTSEQYRIFISYAGADFEHFQIEKIAHSLETKHPNIKCRYYKRNIQPGQDLIDYMEAGVLWSNVFLWFHSENSAQSGAVDKEYKMAEYEKKKIITITEDFNKLRPAVRVTWVVSHINDVDKMCEEIYRGIKS